MSEISLELKNIKKSFQEGEDVLESICLTAKKGEFVTLLGSSGCGKTTTLRIIAGLEQPDSGQVFLDGKDCGAIAFSPYALEIRDITPGKQSSPS